MPSCEKRRRNVIKCQNISGPIVGFALLERFRVAACLAGPVATNSCDELLHLSLVVKKCRNHQKTNMKYKQIKSINSMAFDKWRSAEVKQKKQLMLHFKRKINIYIYTYICIISIYNGILAIFAASQAAVLRCRRRRNSCAAAAQRRKSDRSHRCNAWRFTNFSGCDNDIMNFWIYIYMNDMCTKSQIHH